MGTRADFYVGTGKKAEWLGSIAWDGYPSGIPSEIKKAVTSRSFRKAVISFLKEREDATLPADGWPWPWDDGQLTDYSYAFSKGKVIASCFGHKWFNPMRKEPNHDDDESKVEFPNMKDRQNITLGRRSGLIVFTSK